MNKVYVAPADTPIEDMERVGHDITHALTDQGLSSHDSDSKEYSASLAGEDALDEFMNHWREAAEALTASPAEELRWRLNTQLQGEDPGQPVNWRGPQ